MADIAQAIQGIENIRKKQIAQLQTKSLLCTPIDPIPGEDLRMLQIIEAIQELQQIMQQHQSRFSLLGELLKGSENGHEKT